MVTTFKSGDIVWAKLKGYRWWPAKIQNETDVSDMLRKSKPKKKFSVIPIYFYGSKDYAWVSYESILSFSDNYQRLSSDPSKPQLFKKSLDDAELDLRATSATPKKLIPTIKKPQKFQKSKQVETKILLNKKRGRPSKNPEQCSSPTIPLIDNFKQDTLDTTGAQCKEAPSGILERPEVPIAPSNSEFISINNESETPVNSKITCEDLLKPKNFVLQEIDLNDSIKTLDEFTDRDTPRKRGRPIKSSPELVKRRGRASNSKSSAPVSSKINFDTKLTSENISVESEVKLNLDDTVEQSVISALNTVPDSLASADLGNTVVPDNDLHSSKTDCLVYNISENTGTSDIGLSLNNSDSVTSTNSEDTVTPNVDFSLRDKHSLKIQLDLNCSDLLHSEVGKATECEAQDAHKTIKHETAPIKSEDLILSIPSNENQSIDPLIAPSQDFVSPSIDNSTSAVCTSPITKPTVKSKKEFVPSTCLKVSRHLSEMHRLRHYLQKYTVVENMENRPEIEIILSQLETGTPDIGELRTSRIVKLLRHLVKKKVISPEDKFYSRCKSLAKKFGKLLNEDYEKDNLGSRDPNDTSRHSKNSVNTSNITSYDHINTEPFK